MEIPAHVPVFRELLERDDVTFPQVVVYGALAHFESIGVAPRAQDIAEAVAREKERVRIVIVQLEQVGLIRREFGRRGPRSTTTYVLLGPKLPNCATSTDRNVA